MNVTDILKMSAKPPVYTEGTAFMWTDEHISNYLLETHLNPELDLASRTKDSIHKTAKWLLNLPSVKNQPDILDLGCTRSVHRDFCKDRKNCNWSGYLKKINRLC